LADCFLSSLSLNICLSSLLCTVKRRHIVCNKVLRFPVHMKTSHQSTTKCKYRSSEKYSNTYYQNKQNINPACTCNIYLINSIILFYLFNIKCIVFYSHECLCEILRLISTVVYQMSTLYYGGGGGGQKYFL
jgi:hypothetical protein